MPRFNVGDRVRCLSNAGGQFTIGNTYIVSRVYSISLSVEADDSGNPNGWGTEHFELAEPQETQEVIKYAVIFQYWQDVAPRSSWFDAERGANNFKHLVEQGHGIVLAMKKLKFTVPIPVFPELEVDEDDNIIEEGNDND